MSILGIGTDIASIERLGEMLERHGERFLARCFQDAERDHFSHKSGHGLAATVAGRWAAKEAFLKALGGTIGHIPYSDVGVTNSADGAPRLVLTGEAATALADRGGQQIHVTISHEREYAVATVLIEA